MERRKEAQGIGVKKHTPQADEKQRNVDRFSCCIWYVYMLKLGLHVTSRDQYPLKTVTHRVVYLNVEEEVEINKLTSRAEVSS